MIITTVRCHSYFRGDPLTHIILGYEQFGLMRSDPALCFKAMCGEEPPGSKKKKKSLAKMALVTAKATGGVTRRVSVGGDDSEGSESGEESEGDGDSGPCTPATPNSKR